MAEVKFFPIPDDMAGQDVDYFDVPAPGSPSREAGRPPLTEEQQAWRDGASAVLEQVEKMASNG